jgi:hypothetical protein
MRREKLLSVLAILRTLLNIIERVKFLHTGSENWNAVAAFTDYFRNEDSVHPLTDISSCLQVA